MYKALLVALIGLFFSLNTHAANVLKMPCSLPFGSGACPAPYLYGNTGSRSEILSLLNGSGESSYSNASGVTKTGAYCFVSSGSYICITYSTSSGAQWVSDTQACSDNPDLSFCEDTQNFCKDGSIAPNGDFGLCPKYTCEDGQIVDSPSYCSTPFECPDGSTPPNNSVPNCPVNCDILSGGGGPDCDIEEPDGYCSDTQSPVFDDCQYGPDDPRNPDNQPEPEDHCEAFPDSVSCNTELPPFPESDYCKQYPNALECKTPDIPDLGTGTNPPPPGGTGTGTDTGTPPTPPPAPPPTNSNSPSNSTDSRLDNLRYDISKLHSGLNYQTGVIARGLTGVSSQLQANGAKTDRSNTLLDGINKNLDVLNGSLKGDPLVSGNFDVESGINTALGITGDEKLSDLVAEPIKLEDYTEQYDQFLSVGQTCPQSLPIQLQVAGRNYNIDIDYRPACDLFAKLGNFLLFITWIAVPSIVFGRRT